MTSRIGAWVAVASALVCGCTSGGNTLDSDCHVTWLDDGVKMTATTGNAIWTSTAGTDSVDILGFNHKIGVEIYAATPTALTAPQTFVCGQTPPDQSLHLTYNSNDPAGPATNSESCTVALTQIGAIGEHVVGTFDVVFDLPGGGTKSITNGSFEVTLSR